MYICAEEMCECTWMGNPKQHAGKQWLNNNCCECCMLKVWVVGDACGALLETKPPSRVQNHTDWQQSCGGNDWGRKYEGRLKNSMQGLKKSLRLTNNGSDIKSVSSHGKKKSQKTRDGLLKILYCSRYCSTPWKRTPKEVGMLLALTSQSRNTLTWFLPIAVHQVLVSQCLCSNGIPILKMLLITIMRNAWTLFKHQI